MDSVLDATGRTKQRLAPHAATARDAALHYAGEARDLTLSTVATVTPQLEQAWSNARDHVRNDLVPAINRTVEPTVELVRERAGVTLSALRGDVTADDLAEVERGRCRRRRARGVGVFLLVAGATCVAAMWWRRRAEPEWLMDEPDLAPDAMDTVDPIDAVAPEEDADSE